jgi:hypothetical protein
MTLFPSTQETWFQIINRDLTSILLNVFAAVKILLVLFAFLSRKVNSIIYFAMLDEKETKRAFGGFLKDFFEMSVVGKKKL